MKKFLPLLALILSPAFAHAEEAFDCSKKFDGEVECKVKKDKVAVKAVAIDGGECVAPNTLQGLRQGHEEGRQVQAARRARVFLRQRIHNHDDGWQDPKVLRLLKGDPPERAAAQVATTITCTVGFLPQTE